MCAYYEGALINPILRYGYFVVMHGSALYYVVARSSAWYYVVVRSIAWYNVVVLVVHGTT